MGDMTQNLNATALPHQPPWLVRDGISQVHINWSGYHSHSLSQAALGGSQNHLNIQEHQLLATFHRWRKQFSKGLFCLSNENKATRVQDDVNGLGPVLGMGQDAGKSPGHLCRDAGSETRLSGEEEIHPEIGIKAINRTKPDLEIARRMNRTEWTNIYNTYRRYEYDSDETSDNNLEQFDT
ncbi:hypothetical protein RND71_023602 [Anisodus tanguticus]|uniref:Uncharacterized protein n=1 Tax=Anisodus tanguticus TaxID=243964 RepID=A0AAE1RVU4_9SOLA|nr:hypothetical protein RND71_023602 [Anisodus tanguticus]